MNIYRRKFLANTGALTGAALAGNLGTWGVESARAQAADYKALVCLFFFGGNDSNNMVVPIDDYAQYSAVRTVASNIQLTQASLLPVDSNIPGNNKKYGLHPNLTSLAPIYTAGKMAILANSGTLLRPTTVAQYKSGGIYRPPNLFSHSDQQYAWMGLMPGAIVRTGWAGRASDKLKNANTGALIPSTVSVSGNQVFGMGNSTVPFVIPQNGGALHGVACAAGKRHGQHDRRWRCRGNGHGVDRGRSGQSVPCRNAAGDHQCVHQSGQSGGPAEHRHRQPVQAGRAADRSARDAGHAPPVLHGQHGRFR
jgi:hypothetical protein